MYASRTGRQLCFAATQQKGVSPADAGNTPNWLSLIFEVEAVPFLIHRHEAIAGLTYAVSEISFEGHAGVLAIQPLRAHIGRKVVQYAASEIKDFYENVVVRHGDIEDFFAENSDYNSKAAIVAYVIQNEASDDTPLRLENGNTFNDVDKESRPCVAASKRKIEAWQKEHPGNGFNLKVFSDTLKKYADELGLEFGDVYYYLVVEDDKADEMGVRV